MRSILSIILLAVALAGCSEEPKETKPASPDTAVVARPDPVPYDTGCVPPPPTRVNAYVGWPEYDTITTDLIRCLPDTTLDRVIYLRISRDFVAVLKRDSASEGSIDEYMAFRRLTPSQRMIMGTWGIEMETSHGGFDQYFLNTSGSFAPDAIGGLKMIGATRVAALAQNAYDLWSAERKRLDDEKTSGIDPAARKRYFDAIDTLSSKFNEAAARADKAENVAWLRVQYIRTHSDEFVTE